MKRIDLRLPGIASAEASPQGVEFREYPRFRSERRRELLTHFGGQQAIMKASQDAIGKVEGISKKLAEIIYAELHNID